MKIKCILKNLDDSQLHTLGRNPTAKNHYSITIGKEYVVFGMTFSFGDSGNGCFVQLLSDHNHLLDVPIVLFEIVDNRLSKYWKIKRFISGDITLWPPSFYQEYYHDDLSEDVREIVEDFNKVKQQITDEF